MTLWIFAIWIGILGLGLIQFTALLVLYSILEHQRKLSGYRYSPKEKRKADE